MTVLLKRFTWVATRSLCRQVFTARKLPLMQSHEVQKQLSMGWQLDPDHKEAPEVPILESIFDDKNIFAKPSDSLASSKWPFVTPDMAFAARPSQIKGANSLFIQAMFQGHRLLRQCKARLEVPNLFTLLYFPPWHPLALGRKSRPALSVITMQGAQYNGNPPALRPSPNEARLSRNPLDYAVWRQRTGRLMRRVLFASKRDTPGFRDGLYISITRRVPTEEEARRAITKFVKEVAVSSHEWAEKQANSLNLAAINKRLVAAKNAPVRELTRREDWEHSISEENGRRMS